MEVEGVEGVNGVDKYVVIARHCSDPTNAVGVDADRYSASVELAEMFQNDDADLTLSDILFCEGPVSYSECLLGLLHLGLLTTRKSMKCLMLARKPSSLLLEGGIWH